jgi:NAD(P)-dependent dehydrogenase (short-subunit alcohol dehydrogenase family)
VVNARGINSLTITAEEIAHSTGRRVLPVPADVSTVEGICTLSSAIRRSGPVDIVVNNAMGGVTASPVRFDRLPESVWSEGLDTNLMAPIRLLRALLPIMEGRTDPNVINIVSSTAFVPSSGRAPYGTTKSAMWALTRYLAVELAPTVRVNAVSPGTTSEDGRSAHPQWDEVLPSIPLHRFGLAKEVADAVLYLAASATYTTGQVLFVDGGRAVAGGTLA